MNIKVGLRDSKLSRKQFEEVIFLLTPFAPKIKLVSLPVTTVGDRDLKTSLLKMDKTDFFTRDIDEMQRAGKCRVTIHSAKDLPEPLPKGLKLVALTEGKDSSDSLVFRSGENLETLKRGALVGSSSYRRSQAILSLRKDLTCVEIRGPVDRRLEQLFQGEIDALVVAEAALIRLELTHLNRITLPGKTTPLQGQLAILAREDDREMEALFASIDNRSLNPGKIMPQTTLYLGLDPSYFKTDNTLVHCPVIQTIPRDFNTPKIRHIFADVPVFTHLIFTSKEGVRIFFDALTHHGHTPSDLEGKKIIAIGEVTARSIEARGIKVTQIAREETQEGIIKMLATQDLDKAYICLPCSALSRPDLAQFLMVRRVRHQLCIIYDTVAFNPKVKPDLNHVDEIVFTSPSTVDAFQKIFGMIPKDKRLTTIGPITEGKLNSLFTN